MGVIKTSHLNIRTVLTLTFIISYGLSAFLFSDLKSINSFYYLRLFIPTVIIFICFIISYKTVNLIQKDNSIYKKYYIISVIIVFFILSLILSNAIKFPLVQFDTWQVFDVSKNVFVDFGRMDMIRQHIINTPYQMAFPPLYPFLMASINMFFNFGVLSSVVINFIVCFLLLYYIVKMGIQTQNVFVSLIISALLLLNTEMVNCYVGGSTIPLNLLLFVITSYIIIKNINKFNVKRVILLSIISGLGVLNRFDYLPVACALGALTIFLNKKVFLKFIVFYFVGLIIMLSPWVIYSKLHFDVFFITDNGRRLINIPDTRPSTFFSIDNPALTFFDDPVLWFHESLKRWLIGIKSLFIFISEYTYVKELFITFTILIGSGLIRMNSNIERLKHYLKEKALFILFIPIFLQTIAILLTGYSDTRYHILVSFFTFYVVLYILFNFLNKNYNLKNYSTKHIVLVLIISLCALIPKLDDYIFEKIAFNSMKALISESNTGYALNISENQHIYDYLSGKVHPRIIINRNEPTIDLPKFAALSNQVTIMSPNNISVTNAKDFVEFFDLNYLYSSDKELVDIFKSIMNVRATEITHLYQLGD
ncbi:hypothetical protein [Litchfieldia alkalitelluris]|uniref:hypothetical protein n=1 Tax=Litchfieldia alkalitelluris TaxID=304268 RepID=UPI00099712AA|nr:hypothetical protein [Litchfieldia alkalitelluris]